MKFPGLIDVHVHLREPGANQKESFETGTRAAVAGGVTYILDMPNNSIPTFTLEALEEKISRVRATAVCDVGFHFGTDGKNTALFATVAAKPEVFGLKVYCNHTTGNFLLDDPHVLEAVFRAWGSEKPILVHAEGEKLAQVAKLAARFGRRLHICHISQKEEVAFVRKAKSDGLYLTAGVTPHHLFVTQKHLDLLGPFGDVRPLIRPENMSALWEGLKDGTIDVVESDHAPHTKEEKQSDNPPSGVPGLETTLGLLLFAVHEKRITLDDVKKLLFARPKEIFAIPDQPDTFIEFDPGVPWVVRNEELKTRCAWSPFAGWELYGKVEKVVLRGNQLL